MVTLSEISAEDRARDLRPYSKFPTVRVRLDYVVIRQERLV